MSRLFVLTVSAVAAAAAVVVFVLARRGDAALVAIPTLVCCYFCFPFKWRKKVMN